MYMPCWTQICDAFCFSLQEGNDSVIVLFLISFGNTHFKLYSGMAVFTLE